ncbi:MAG: glutaredoxin 3 [Myxacorys californica WJT36-NPBG1]|jgi:glutaredoxin 3|nr:glutaredoxin 3 [Myxacorys californica WJT36-NPBG1]
MQFFDFLLGRTSDQLNSNVEIYTWQTCPYCIRAKLLLRWKGVKFTDYKIDGDGAARVRMANRANGRRTVPQIFINDQHIGGCDELYALDREGKLDLMLSEEGKIGMREKE